VARALRTAQDAGLLTVALVGGDGGQIARIEGLDHVLVGRSDDPRVVKEIHVTAYHVLWELVHVFFEQPGVLAPSVLR
jgi:D-sedoheptulose 7-phosphate isomerase